MRYGRTGIARVELMLALLPAVGAIVGGQVASNTFVGETKATLVCDVGMRL